MVIKIYISGISASKQVKKKQQRAILMLDSFNVNYEAIDITEPGREEERDAVQHSFKSRTTDKRTPLPPQFFNDDEYCGDYEDFNAAVDVDQLLVFLKLEELQKTMNGVTNGIDGNQDSKGIARNKEEEIEGEKIEDIFVDGKKQVESDSADDAEAAILEKEAEKKLKDAKEDSGEEERSDAEKPVDKETVDAIKSIESNENDEGEGKQSSEEEDEPIENEETKQLIVESSLKLADNVAESKERHVDDEREDKLLPEIQKNESEEEESEEDSIEITKKDVEEKALEDSEERIAEMKDEKQAEITRNAQDQEKESEEETDEESED